MGTVVVGYVPKPEGDAALATAISEAKLRGSKLVVVNSHRGGHEYDADAARKSESDMDNVRQQLDGSGVEYDIRQLVRVRGKFPGQNEPQELMVPQAFAMLSSLSAFGMKPTEDAAWLDVVIVATRPTLSVCPVRHRISMPL